MLTATAAAPSATAIGASSSPTCPSAETPYGFLGVMMHSVNSDRSLAPVHLASRHGRVRAITVLLSVFPLGWRLPSGPPGTSGLGDGFMLHRAVRSGEPKAIRAIFSFASEAATLRNEHQALPLHLACYDCKAGIIPALVECYPESVRATQHDGKVPLHLLTRNSREEDLRAILSVWPDAVRAVDDQGWTPLHHAAFYRNKKMIAWLLSLWPDAALVHSSADTNEETPLHVASKYGHKDGIVLLLAAKPESIRLVNKDGRTALHYACLKNHIVAIKMLASTWFDGCDVKDRLGGNTPVHVIVALGNRDALEAIDGEARKFHPTSVYGTGQNDRGQTPLHLAIMCHHVTAALVVNRLVSRWPGALRVKDNNGRTPLMCIAQCPSPRWEQLMALRLDQLELRL